jgi:hypothetical protein
MPKTNLTPEQLAVSIWIRLGEGIFGTLQGAEPTEAEIKAHEKLLIKKERRKREHS